MKKFLKHLTNGVSTPLIIIFGLIILVYFILGSVLDFSLAKSLFNQGKEIASFLDCILPLPAYLLFSISGILLCSTKKDYHSKLKNILASLPCFVTPILSGLAFGFFSLSNLMDLPYALIVAICLMGLTAIGYYFYFDKEMTDFFAEGLMIITVSLLTFLIVFGLNKILIRVNYEGIASVTNDNLFSPWWNLISPSEENIKEIALEDKYLHSSLSLSSAFSSFTLLLPLPFRKKERKYQFIFIPIAILFLALNVFTELSLGKFYLSSIALSLIIAFAFIGASLLFLSSNPASNFLLIKKEHQEKVIGENAFSKKLRLTKISSKRRKMMFKKKLNKKKGIIILKSIDAISPISKEQK